MIHFTSDSHFGHARIIALCGRPFADVAAMDEAMVRRWNEVVAADDEVWHLGDFAAYRDGRAEGVFWRLNGRKFARADRRDAAGPHESRRLAGPYALDGYGNGLMRH